MADTNKNNGPLDPNIPTHQMDIYLEGEVIEGPAPDTPFIATTDLYEGIKVDGEEIPEQPYDGNCLEVIEKKKKQLSRAQYNLLESLSKDPLVVETEVDGLRVKRNGARAAMELNNYLNSSMSALKHGHIKYFYLKANGYGKC